MKTHPSWNYLKPWERNALTATVALSCLPIPLSIMDTPMPLWVSNSLLLIIWTVIGVSWYVAEKRNPKKYLTKWESRIFWAVYGCGLTWMFVFKPTEIYQLPIVIAFMCVMAWFGWLEYRRKRVEETK